MSVLGIFRGATVVAFTPFALVAMVGSQSASAGPALTPRNIQVDVSPLRENVGEPTASWVQRDLAQALAGRLRHGGAPLVVRIDYLSFSSGARVDCGSSRDNISGVATIGGVQTPVRATTSYLPAPGDATMIEQSNQDRVSLLTQALAYWIAQDASF